MKLACPAIPLNQFPNKTLPPVSSPELCNIACAGNAEEFCGGEIDASGGYVVLYTSGGLGTNVE
jgi:hypothetical protein